MKKKRTKLNELTIIRGNKEQEKDNEEGKKKRKHFSILIDIEYRKSTRPSSTSIFRFVRVRFLLVVL